MARPRTRTLVVAGVAIALLVAAAIPTARFLAGRADRRQLRAAAQSFAAAWQAGRLETVSYAGTPGAQVAARAAAITAGLTPAPQERPTTVELLDTERYRGNRAIQRLSVRWDLGQNRTWSYQTSTELVRGSSGWQVAWAPSVIHPQLVDGQVLTTDRLRADRGRILGTAGQVLVTARPVVIVGIEPGRTTDRRATAAAVAAAVDVDAAALTKRVVAAAPTTFVDAITLRRADYEAVRTQLQPIPGAVFRETTLSLAPTAGFARAVLGTVGPATAEIIKESDGRVQDGDVAGLSGVQRRYDTQLAGRAGWTVRAVPAKATEPTGAAGTAGTAPPTTTLHSVAAVPGQDLQLSLDERVQRAAEAALTAAPKPAGLVAIRPSTGEILAVANGGPNAAGYNRALIGRYPPGSTFKIVTTYALLEDGLSPDTPVPCPPTLNVGGRVFQNAEGEALGTVPFRTDFAQSCNTAFVGSSRRITPAQLFDAASTLGYGRPNSVGVDAFTGSVPRSGDTVAHAADSIGQGTVLASPLSVATVSASIAAGRYVPPRLVLGTAPAGQASPSPSIDPSASASPGNTPSAEPSGSTDLPTQTVTQLQELTRLVVTSGTGTAVRGVPGAPVHGKTGTAEFGNADPPETHAWFTGFQGDLAFAVVVEGGGFGGKVAGPLAARFLTALA